MDPQKHRGIFSTTNHQQASDKYFLQSGDKIRFHLDFIQLNCRFHRPPSKQCYHKKCMVDDHFMVIKIFTL